jgi:hypothetical protein
MAIRKKSLFYLGLIIFATAAIVLAYVLYMGPYNRISERRTITYGYPTGPKFEDIKPGDKLELNYESNKPINIILLRTKDSGEYFNNPASTVKPIVLATDSTGGYIEHTFETSGTWGVYFENPNPPPRAPPVVEYWGFLKMERENITMHYLNISVSIILIILGLALIISSKMIKQQKDVKKKKPKKKK